MKVLFIGGTGNISTPSSRLAVKKGIDLYLLNRGSSSSEIAGTHTIIGDINKPQDLPELKKQQWDVVVNWIAFTPEENFPITIVRPSHTYDTVIPIAIGGFKEYTTADRIIKGKEIIIHGDGTSLWTVTHADDFALGFVGLLGLDKAIGHAFHITSDKILANSLGYELNAVHIASDFICEVEPSYTGSLLADKAESVLFDNTKIKTFVPEFKATIPFSVGIKRTLKWLDDHPEKKIINPESNRKIDHILACYKKLFS